MKPIAIQLIEKNIEPIEARLTRAVQLGQPNPIALIYDLDCSLGQKIIALLNDMDGRMKQRACSAIAEAPEDRIPLTSQSQIGSLWVISSLTRWMEAEEK